MKSFSFNLLLLTTSAAVLSETKEAAAASLSSSSFYDPTAAAHRPTPPPILISKLGRRPLDPPTYYTKEQLAGREKQQQEELTATPSQQRRSHVARDLASWTSERTGKTYRFSNQSPTASPVDNAQDAKDQEQSLPEPLAAANTNITDAQEEEPPKIVSPPKTAPKKKQSPSSAKYDVSISSPIPPPLGSYLGASEQRQLSSVASSQSATFASADNEKSLGDSSPPAAYATAELMSSCIGA